MLLPRRTVIQGLISFVAAPVIVRVDSLMKLPKPDPSRYWLSFSDFAYWGMRGPPPSTWRTVPGRIAQNLTTGNIYVHDGIRWLDTTWQAELDKMH